MKKGLLKQIFIKVILVLIAFFSLHNVDASSFAYNDFDWDAFYKEHVGYWTDYCKTQNGDISLDDCLEVTLSGKKEYYVTLYKMLAKYEKKGYKLDDNIILATTFYYLTPDSFSDLPEEYLRDYIDGSAYGLDGDIDSYEVDTDFNQEYFEGEADTLKMLTKHMFSYPAKCTDGNGNVIDTYHLTYTEYLLAKWNFIGKFFGFKDKYREECVNAGGNYQTPTGKQIDYDTYWRFLEESEYFDEKVHLTSKYSKILKETNHTLMKELSKEEKEPYEEELIKIRKMMVLEIKSILESYGKKADTPDSYFSAGNTSGSAWWPIGSDEVTNENGVTLALGEPVSVTVTSNFGPRVHPITGENSQHSGIDIGGVTEGVTNVITVKDGVVVYPTNNDATNCPSSSSLDSCGGGYGNYVIIQHNDGTYSLYAHMYAGSITVKSGDSVKQGQVIGKVGSSGNSTGAHLHFEIRQGTNSSSSAIDPLTYISAENPRSVSGGSSSEMLKMLHHFEGDGCNAKKNGNNYVVIDDGVGIPTAGYGVALKYNIDNFKNYGIDVTNMTFGSEIPIDIVDNVESIKINSFRTNVQNILAKNSITLTEYQVDCLTMVSYQFGNIGNFASSYQQYGNTESLKNSTYSVSRGNPSWYYFKSNPSTDNGRAEATWKLFHEGIYTYGDNC